VSEARTGTRFPLELTTTIRGSKAKARLKGKTSDLSAAGVYILTDGDFEVGSPVEFDITLPAEVIGASKDVEIRCQGRVVRASHKRKGKTKGKMTKKDGVACVIDQYEFVRTK